MTVSTVADALHLEPTGPHTFRAENCEIGERGIVFGGQLIAQLIVAGATVDPAKTVKSAHALFARPVGVADPVELRVDVLQAGRTFASASTSVWQDGTERARALVLLSADEPDLIRHASAMPPVPPADAVAPSAFSDDTRVIGDVDIYAVDATGDPAVDVWFRVSAGAPGQAESRALLAHSSASFLIGAAMRPHPGFGQATAHAEFSTGIVGHTISFHEPVDIETWHLLAHRSTYAGRGRAFGVGEVFSADGRLVASFSQESMVRHLSEAAAASVPKARLL
jgi:acyl-CoA thioesterase-2